MKKTIYICDKCKIEFDKLKPVDHQLNLSIIEFKDIGLIEEIHLCKECQSSVQRWYKSPSLESINELWNLPEDVLAMNQAIHSMAELISEYRFRHEAQTKPEMGTSEKIIEEFMDKARDYLEDKQKS